MVPVNLIRLCIVAFAFFRCNYALGYVYGKPPTPPNSNAPVITKSPPQYQFQLTKIPSKSEMRDDFIQGMFLRMPEDGARAVWTDPDPVSPIDKLPEIFPEEEKDAKLTQLAEQLEEQVFGKTNDASIANEAQIDTKRNENQEIAKAKREADIERLHKNIRIEEAKLAKENQHISLERRNKIEEDAAENELYRYGPKKTQYVAPTPGEKVVFQANKKQLQASEKNMPGIPETSREYFKTQILPPNIAQKVYYGSNTHLAPVTFQYQLDAIAFSLTEKANDLPNLRAMLHKISSINVQTTYGNTLLIYSILNRNVDAVVVLMQNGANINQTNDFLMTPLHLAAYMKDHLSIALLLEGGARINEIDQNEMTPLMYATMRQDQLSIEFLVEYGANIDFTNRNGINAISIADEYGNIAIKEYLRSKSFSQSLFG